MSEGTVALADALATAKLGDALGRVMARGDVVLLSGELGVGKTTLARGALAALGYAGEVASPTFPIVIAYDPPQVRLPLLHVDLYRIGQPAELDELGLDDAQQDGALLIEWPEQIGAWLARDALRLRLEPDGRGGRALTWQAPAAWEARWPPPPL